MSDTYTTTATTNFNKSVVEAINKKLDDLLRGGLSYTLPGSVIGATLMPGNNGVFRSFSVEDLSEDGAVSIEDGQPDPDVEDLAIDYIEFTGTAKARTVGITDNVRARSPFNMFATAAERVGRDIAVSIDNVPRALYKAASPDVYGSYDGAALADVGSGDNMTAQLLDDGVAILRNRNVKPLSNGLYAFVADPLVIRDLRRDPDFVNEIRHADPGSILTGEVARYGGASIIDAGSRGIVNAAAGAGGNNVHRAVIIGANAVFAALGGLQIIPVTGADKADPVNRRDLVSWKGFLGGILNDLQDSNRFYGIAVTASLDPIAA